MKPIRERMQVKVRHGMESHCYGKFMQPLNQARQRGCMNFPNPEDTIPCMVPEIATKLQCKEITFDGFEYIRVSGTEDPDLPLGSFDSDSPPPSVCQGLEKLNHADNDAANAMKEAKAAPEADGGSEAVAATAESREVPSLPTPAPAL